ncbi:hypothetical protein NR798_10160 [Archangium gephyra]|uniref:hypothetical protein n=1 Tax=Archangium gephyra TaxID=48 RepID=UPI0035D47028
MGYAIIVFLGLMPLVWAMSISPLTRKIDLLERRLRRMDAILNQIANQVGVSVSSSVSPMDNELRALVKEDKKLEAIKKVVTELGLSLKEAKAYVEAL